MENHETENNEETSNKIFDLAWEMHLTNFHIITKVNRTEPIWSLITYLPYQRDCHTLTLKLMDTFTPENYTKQLKIPFSELYPEKMKNMNGCTVHIAVVHVEPYVIKYLNGTQPIFDGIDVRIVNEVANEMNFNAEFMQPKDGRQRGIIYENRTATGALRMVIG